MSPKKQQLARRSATPLCILCGHPVDRESTGATRAAATIRMCSACCSSQHGESENAHLEEVHAILQERARVGRLLGNGGAVEYPDGIDHRLSCLLDDLRTVQIRVRATLIRDSIDGNYFCEVHDGHLRRVQNEDENEFSNHSNGSLGLYNSPSERFERWAFDEGDFGSLISIHCADRLLIGSGPPRLIWTEQASVREARRRSRQQRFEQRRRMATLFVVHLAAVALFVVAGGSLATCYILRGDRWSGAFWGGFWAIGSFVGVATLIAWDSPQRPAVSILWRRQTAYDKHDHPEMT